MNKITPSLWTPLVCTNVTEVFLIRKCVKFLRPIKFIVQRPLPPFDLVSDCLRCSSIDTVIDSKSLLYRAHQ